MAKAKIREYRIPLMRKEKVFYAVNGLFLTLFFITTLYPLLCLISSAISEPTAVYTGRVTFYPVGFSLRGFEINLQNINLLNGFKNSVIYTVLGTALIVSVTMVTAFALSRRELIGRSALSFFFAFTLVSGCIHARLSMRWPSAAMTFLTSLSISALVSGGKYFAT